MEKTIQCNLFNVLMEKLRPRMLFPLHGDAIHAASGVRASSSPGDAIHAASGVRASSSPAMSIPPAQASGSLENAS